MGGRVRAMSQDEGEEPSAFRVETRKARERHTCSECERAIEPGDAYEHASGLWGDEWDTFRTCEACVAFRPYVEAEAGRPIGYEELLATARDR